MPQALTRDFGTIEYHEDTELRFPRGLPGFEDQNRFLLIEPEALAPIVFLQSLSTPVLCFLAVSVWVVDPEYQIGITPDDLTALDLATQPHSGGDVLCLAILSAQDNGPSTANLLAPVVINPRTRVGVQAVRADAAYSHQHPLPFTGLEEPACS
jgi:flagellar assembly factor FliW